MSKITFLQIRCKCIQIVSKKLAKREDKLKLFNMIKEGRKGHKERNQLRFTGHCTQLIFIIFFMANTPPPNKKAQNFENFQTTHLFFIK